MGSAHLPPILVLEISCLPASNACVFFFEFFIFFRSYRFQPFISGIITRDLDGKMGKPTVPCRSVPMLYMSWDLHHISGMKLSGRLSPFLVPAAACRT